MKKLFFVLTATLFVAVSWAQGVKPLPTLRVEGRWLVDQHGNHVVLHGVMDGRVRRLWDGGTITITRAPPIARTILRSSSKALRLPNATCFVCTWIRLGQTILKKGMSIRVRMVRLPMWEAKPTSRNSTPRG